MLEVVIQRLVLVRHDSQRRIISHRSDRFVARQCHRRHQEFNIFLGVAEGLLLIQQRHVGLRQQGRIRQIAEFDAHRINPLLVRFGIRVRIFDFLVVDNATGVQIDQKHFTWLQAPFFNDLGFRNRQGARFRRHHHQIIVGDDVTCRTQAVAIQRAADLATVGKGHGGRTVPRFHHRGMIFIKRAPVVVHHGVIFPGFRNHHHHRLRYRVAGHDQQLQRIVEAGGIGLAFKNQRIQFLQIGAQDSRAHDAFTGAHPVEVTLDGIDLAVMSDHPVRMRQRPFREGIRGETLMHQSQRRNETRVL